MKRQCECSELRFTGVKRCESNFEISDGRIKLLDAESEIERLECTICGAEYDLEDFEDLENKVYAVLTQ